MIHRSNDTQVREGKILRRNAYLIMLDRPCSRIEEKPSFEGFTSSWASDRIVLVST